MTWVKIKQNENYSINENGEVKNNKKGTLLKSHINKKAVIKWLACGAITKISIIQFTGF